MRHDHRGSLDRRGFLRTVGGVLGVAGAAALTGCDVLGSGQATKPPLPNPLTSFLRDTVALANLYDAAIKHTPVLSPILTPPRDNHRAHAQALAKALELPAPNASAGPSPTAAPTGDRAAVLATLVAAETAGHDAAVQACVATTARLAPLVGSIAAARASHLEVLK
jgi:hypothetical protein